MTASDTVLVERDGPVTIVSINRPERRNAVDGLTARTLYDTFRAFDSDVTASVAVFTGIGGHFCAGADLKAVAAGDINKKREIGGHDSIAPMGPSRLRLSKPVIAAVDGIATAAGCQLVACCDLAIATDRATFGVNGIDVGLFCTTPSVALSRNISRKHAMEMLLTGEMIDAKTARDFGLVNRVVPPEYLNQIVNKYAETIAAKSPTAVRMGKKGFYEQAGLGLAEAYASASRVMVENMLARDAEEGIAAFIGKRKPQWTGE